VVGTSQIHIKRSNHTLPQPKYLFSIKEDNISPWIVLVMTYQLSRLQALPSCRRNTRNSIHLRHIVLRYGFRCNTCHRIPTYPTVDHIIPKFLGGTDKKGNLQILCLTCHRHKDLYIGRWLPLMYKEKIKIRTLVTESGRIYFSYP
jgi:5-methylcytosine-specific restriction endonuclease McrA